MKINLLNDSDDVLSGFTNIDPYGSRDDVVIGPVDDLNGIAEDAQCIEIVARDIIDYVPADKIDQTLYGWLRKLRHGGKITLGGTDLYLVSLKHHRGEIDAETATNMLYGARTKPHYYKKNCTTLTNLENFLTNEGLKILLKKYDYANCKYILVAQRQ